jgi:hypothetical protein
MPLVRLKHLLCIAAIALISPSVVLAQCAT